MVVGGSNSAGESMERRAPGEGMSLSSWGELWGEGGRGGCRGRGNWARGGEGLGNLGGLGAC